MLANCTQVIVTVQKEAAVAAVVLLPQEDEVVCAVLPVSPESRARLMSNHQEVGFGSIAQVNSYITIL